MELSKFEVLNIVANKTKDLANIKHKHKVKEIDGIEDIIAPYVKNDVLNAKIKEFDNKVKAISLKTPLDR